ncbi:MAG TPA: GNAT family N-acetyltransferase [Steroidobacteraceae bacterium]|nr:GNAT family N-acetyltransferase [Steroidobacteraceae bacterium]
MCCTEEAHAAPILEIFNEAIANSTAIYEYAPRTARTIAEWFAGKRDGGQPVIGLVDAAGRLVGFGTYGTFRARPAYKYTVEHSLYVHKDWRGRGLGTQILRELIGLARRDDVHVMIGGIDAANRASIALHERLGFRLAGTIKESGFKFGRWLDLAFYDLILDTPRQPIDG